VNLSKFKFIGANGNVCSAYQYVRVCVLSLLKIYIGMLNQIYLHMSNI
jgi:hypothetical protein